MANFELQKLAEEIEAFKPLCDQERADKRLFLQCLEAGSQALDRSALAHFTCSAWAVDPTGESTLLVYHNIYNSWSWIGGHADGEADLEAVALRELAEETGVQDARILEPFKWDNSAGNSSRILSIEALPVSGHMKRGAYVSSHVHLNVTYLAVCDPSARLREKPDENSAVRWAFLDEVCALSSEPWMCERVYKKLIDRTREAFAHDSLLG